MQRELEGLDATVKAADERTREANVARAAAEAEAMAAKPNSLQRTPGRKGPSSAHWPLRKKLVLQSGPARRPHGHTHWPRPKLMQQ